VALLLLPTEVFKLTKGCKHLHWFQRQEAV
jgi:hypothetical protein